MRPRSPRRRRESRSPPQGSAWSRCLSGGRAEGSSPVSESSTAWCCGTSRGQSREPAQRYSQRQPETDVQTADGSDQLLQSRPGTTVPGSGKGHQDWRSFDNIDHTLLSRAVQKHVKCKWAILYIERWLTAPMVLEDGTRVERSRGTPQGGVVSPVLANLFLHYAFDLWMARAHPELPWCRYADDGLVHCRTEQEAQAVKADLQIRLAECQLEMHPTKTKIVDCKDGQRTGKYPIWKFDFLGYTFRPRLVKNSRRNSMFWSFTPAVSATALKSMRQTIRELNFRQRTQSTLGDIARKLNPILRGWMEYYGRYCPSALCPSRLCL